MNGERKHTCNVCLKCSPWGSGWQYYASIMSEEDGLPVLKTCSDACRSQVDDPASWLLQLWEKMKVKPRPAILKTMKRLPTARKATA